MRLDGSRSAMRELPAVSNGDLRIVEATNDFGEGIAIGQNRVLRHENYNVAVVQVFGSPLTCAAVIEFGIDRF